MSKYGEGFNRVRRGAPLALFIVTLLAFALLLRWWAKDLLQPEQALALMRRVQHEPWAVGAFLGSYLLCTTVFFPAVLFHMVAGAAWGFPLGLLLNVIACNVGASLQFALARRVGRERVAGWMARSRVQAFEWSRNPGLREAIVIRAFPFPTMAVNAGAGLSAIRWRDFALGTLIGTFPVTAIYTWAAAMLVEGLSGVRQRVIVPVVISAVLLIVVSYGPKWWMRRRRRSA